MEMMRNPEDLIGYRFDPNDEDLIEYYLFPKVHGLPIFNGIVPDADVYTSEPETLIQQGLPISTDLDNKVCYFFADRTRKSAKGKYAKRVLDLGNGISAGSWTCKDRPNKIINKITKEILGTKRLLTYKKDGKFTEWRMHEYTLEGRNVKAANPNLSSPSSSSSSVLGKRKAELQFLDHVLCRLFLKPPSGNKNQEDQETEMEEDDDEAEEEPSRSQYQQLEEQQEQQQPISSSYPVPMSQPRVPTSFTEMLAETEKFLFDEEENLTFNCEDIGKRMEEPIISQYHQLEEQQQATTSYSVPLMPRVPTSFTDILLSETEEFLLDDDENLTFTHQDIGQWLGELS